MKVTTHRSSVDIRKNANFIVEMAKREVVGDGVARAMTLNEKKNSGKVKVKLLIIRKLEVRKYETK